MVFRVLLVGWWACIALYTAIVAAEHGLGLLPIFFGDIAKLGWPGQFNLDFMSLLSLSGLWVAWRNGFSPAGLALGAIAFFFGGFFLTAYLLIESVRARGDVEVLLLGPERMSRLSRRAGEPAAAQRR